MRDRGLWQRGASSQQRSLNESVAYHEQRLRLSPDEAYARRSQHDGHEVLQLTTESFKFETQRIEEGGAWFFNGAVAGDQSTVNSQVQHLSDVLRWAGYRTQFEIYDADFNCIAEIGSEKTV